MFWDITNALNVLIGREEVCLQRSSESCCAECPTTVSAETMSRHGQPQRGWRRVATWSTGTQQLERYTIQCFAKHTSLRQHAQLVSESSSDVLQSYSTSRNVKQLTILKAVYIVVIHNFLKFQNNKNNTTMSIQMTLCHW